jgi:hypothetical protein
MAEQAWRLGGKKISYAFPELNPVSSVVQAYPNHYSEVLRFFRYCFGKPL